MQILVLIPVADPTWIPAVQTQIDRVLCNSGHTAVVECLDAGPRFIDSVQTEIASAREVIRTCQALPLDRYDAVLVDCFGEPGVAELQRAFAIPVTGACVPALHEASVASDDVVVVLPNQELAEHVAPRIRALHAGARVVALAEPRETETLLDRLEASIERGVTGRARSAVVLGCTAWASLAPVLAHTFEPAVRIVEPEGAALRALIAELPSRQAIEHAGLPASRISRSMIGACSKLMLEQGRASRDRE